MKLLLRQRVFAWFDSYDIYDEDGSVCYTVKGQLSWGHCFRIWDASGAEVGMIKQVVLTWLPRFDIYVGGRRVGTIRKELTLFKPKFTLDITAGPSTATGSNGTTPSAAPRAKPSRSSPRSCSTGRTSTPSTRPTPRTPSPPSWSPWPSTRRSAPGEIEP